MMEIGSRQQSIQAGADDHGELALL